MISHVLPGKVRSHPAGFRGDVPCPRVLPAQDVALCVSHPLLCPSLESGHFLGKSGVFLVRCAPGTPSLLSAAGCFLTSGCSPPTGPQPGGRCRGRRSADVSATAGPCCPSRGASWGNTSVFSDCFRDGLSLTGFEQLVMTCPPLEPLTQDLLVTGPAPRPRVPCVSVFPHLCPVVRCALLLLHLGPTSSPRVDGAAVGQEGWGHEDARTHLHTRARTSRCLASGRRGERLLFWESARPPAPARGKRWRRSGPTLTLEEFTVTGHARAFPSNTLYRAGLNETHLQW